MLEAIFAPTKVNRISIRITCALVLVPCLLIPMTGVADLSRQFGPFDYTNAQHRVEHLPVVETYHFNSDVQNLVRGQGSSVWGDLDYVLTAFPNHHRALLVLSELFQLKPTIPEAKLSHYFYGHSPDKTPDWYFREAMKFAPHDAAVKHVYAIHLHNTQQFARSKKMYEEALAQSSDTVEIHYNYGLLLVDLGQHVEAFEHAKQAYKLGHPLPGLRNKLIAAGSWPQN